MQTSEYLETIKNFLIGIHHDLSQQNLTAITHNDVETIDKASILIKSYKAQAQTVHKDQQQVKKQRLEKIHQQKRLQQKNDEISVLRETVKTLYNDNQKIIGEKLSLSKEMNSLKEANNVLKKKYRRQEDQATSHRVELQKLTAMAQQKLNQYAREDHQKKNTIKKLNNEIQKLKSQATKKEKQYQSLTAKYQETKRFQNEYQKAKITIDQLHYENNRLKAQIQSINQQLATNKDQNQKLNETIQLKQVNINQLKQNNDKLLSELKEKQQNLRAQLSKYTKYEDEILMRTQKLKQKNKQIQVYSEEINKLVNRIQQISSMAEEVINENTEMAQRCRSLELTIEQSKQMYKQFDKLKGQISYKKSLQLKKLIDSLGKLHDNI